VDSSSTEMTRRTAVAAIADIASIIVFVAIGRRNHDEGGNPVSGALSVAAPFLIALVIAWIVARAWRSPAAPLTGMIIWPTTVVIGLLLRRFAFDSGTAVPFIIVASLFTGLLLVGWRLIAEWRTNRQPG